MAAEKAVGLVVRTHDWSETSRIATIWTREFGKVRVLAKGGRRLKSSFEVALDLLTVCSIVLVRKTSGGLDLLTEARVDERFAGLKKDLRALYGGYYIAELLGEGTQEYDPHPALYDRSLDIMRKLAAGGEVNGLISGYELSWLDELGLRPVLDRCAVCETLVPDAERVIYSALAGGLVCDNCAATQRDRRSLSQPGLETLRELAAGELPKVTAEVRQLLGHVVSTALGRRPRLLSYLN